MTKTEVLIYGMIIQADIFEDGHGTDKKDEELLRKALFKTYKVTAEASDEELEKLDEQLKTDNELLVKEYREKIVKFLE